LFGHSVGRVDEGQDSVAAVDQRDSVVLGDPCRPRTCAPLAHHNDPIGLSLVLTAAVFFV